MSDVPDLYQVLANIRDAITDLKTGRCLKRAWRQMICHYVYSVRSSNFPVWVRKHLDDKSISACLEAEFGRDHLDGRYPRTKSSAKYRIAVLCGLEHPRLLALWFGADFRTPSRDTLRHLCQKMESEDPATSLSASAFMDNIYPHLIRSWARRQAYTFDEPNNMLPCIFGRQPLPDLAESARARLSLKDFKDTGTESPALPPLAPTAPAPLPPAPTAPALPPPEPMAPEPQLLAPTAHSNTPHSGEICDPMDGDTLVAESTTHMSEADVETISATSRLQGDSQKSVTATRAQE
jgi:hypothetical protein